jgi:hypothetical protein
MVLFLLVVVPRNKMLPFFRNYTYHLLARMDYLFNFPTFYERGEMWSPTRAAHVSSTDGIV